MHQDATRPGQFSLRLLLGAVTLVCLLLAAAPHGSAAAIFSAAGVLVGIAIMLAARCVGEADHNPGMLAYSTSGFGALLILYASCLAFVEVPEFGPGPKPLFWIMLPCFSLPGLLTLTNSHTVVFTVLVANFLLLPCLTIAMVVVSIRVAHERRWYPPVFWTLFCWGNGAAAAMFVRFLREQLG
jgi:hypothetical protein